MTLVSTTVRFGQSNQCKHRKAAGQMGFDGDGGGFHAHLGATVDDGQGHALSLNAKGPLPAVLED